MVLELLKNSLNFAMSLQIFSAALNKTKSSPVRKFNPKPCEIYHDCNGSQQGLIRVEVSRSKHCETPTSLFGSGSTQKGILYFDLVLQAHSKFLRLHFEHFGSTPTTLSRAERGTSRITKPNLCKGNLIKRSPSLMPLTSRRPI